MPKFGAVEKTEQPHYFAPRITTNPAPRLALDLQYEQSVKEHSTNPGRLVGISRHAHHVLSDMVTRNYVIIEKNHKAHLYDIELMPIREVLFNTLENFRDRDWVDWDSEVMAWYANHKADEVIKLTGTS